MTKSPGVWMTFLLYHEVSRPSAGKSGFHDLFHCLYLISGHSQSHSAQAKKGINPNCCISLVSVKLVHCLKGIKQVTWLTPIVLLQFWFGWDSALTCRGMNTGPLMVRCGVWHQSRVGGKVGPPWIGSDPSHGHSITSGWGVLEARLMQWTVT